MSASQSVSVSQTDSRATWIGRTLILLAVVLWSTSGFFSKAPIFENWPIESRGNLLVFWRAITASMVLVFLVRKVSWTWRLVPGIFCFAAMNWAFLGAMVSGEAALAIWLQYTAPVWVFLGSWYWFRETPTRGDWALLALSVMGVGLIIFSQISGEGSRGLVLGLLAGVFFGGVVLSLKWLKDLDSAWIIFLFHFVTGVAFLPSLLQSQIYPSGNQWFYLFGFGVLQLGIPYVLFARGVRSVSSHEASGLSLLEPVLVPVWVFIAWSHRDDYQAPELTTLIGAGLILAGLAMRYSQRTTPAVEDE